MLEARGCGQEEQPHVRGQGQQPRGSGNKHLGTAPLTFMDGTLLKGGFCVWLVQNSADISFSEKLSWTWLTVLVLLL